MCWHLAVIWIYKSPNLYIAILTPRGDGVRRGELEEVLRAWEGSLLNGSSALDKEAAESSWPLPRWGPNRKSVTHRKTSPSHAGSWSQTSSFQALRNASVVWKHPVCGILLCCPKGLSHFSPRQFVHPPPPSSGRLMLVLVLDCHFGWVLGSNRDKHMCLIYGI